jgi:death on curing protein
MAAAYAYHLAENQPFIDGNKRTALNAAIVFLGLNGFDVFDDDGRLYEAMMALASGQLDKGPLAALLDELSRPWSDDK